MIWIAGSFFNTMTDQMTLHYVHKAVELLWVFDCMNSKLLPSSIPCSSAPKFDQKGVFYNLMSIGQSTPTKLTVSTYPQWSSNLPTIVKV